jgi:cellulose synthase/poly-beta-1,6-N-acetylglucosamine synthase-like glycosyltransferase
MIPTLATIPWVLLLAALPLVLWRRPRLNDYGEAGSSGSDGSAPRVSIILPTQDDADRVGVCLATLLDSDYPDYEVVVVDNQSHDGTREIVEALRARSPERIRLVRTGPVPDGRPWRAWACMRGCRESDGDLLLFTEPGTVHDAPLLRRAVAALEAEDADLVTVRPRLTMHGFWERLVMPHVWLVLRARFPSARLVNRSRSPRNAVGHHQFFLFRRRAYEAIGGHEQLEPGTVEDLAVPQAVVAAGLRLFVVHGDAYLETRMVRTLSDISGGWTGAVPPASRTTVAPWAELFVPWVVAATPVVLFVLPPLFLLVGSVLPGWESATRWGLAATALSLAFWLVVYAVHRIRPAYAMAYPAGALATSVIFVRSILRHGRES